MDYAVVLYFDEQSQARLLSIMENICDAGINRYMLDVGIRPHITLAAWNDEKERDLTNEIKQFALEVEGTGVLFSSIGIFPADQSVVYLSPVKDDNLNNIHSRFYQKLGGLIGNFVKYYTPDHWVPHCTLAAKLTKAEVLESVSILMDIQFPIKATISQVELIKCKPMEEILSCEVKFQHDI